MDYIPKKYKNKKVLGIYSLKFDLEQGGD